MLSSLDLCEPVSYLFKSASEFSQFVELTALSEARTCTSVILDYCEDNDLDADDIQKLISRPLREKIMVEMQEEGYLRKTSELPFE